MRPKPKFTGNYHVRAELVAFAADTAAWEEEVRLEAAIMAEEKAQLQKASFAEALEEMARVSDMSGPPGASGENGLNGLNGTDGADGVGNEWLTGAGVPGGGLGNDGDFYLDTNNGDVYQKVVGAWGLITNIQGADGADGIDGTNGTNGTDGVDGAAGADGTDGVDGNDWRVAAGVPAIIAGDEEGDLYLNSTNGDVYQVQTGAWVLVTNIQGADGADGADGTNGTNGTDGVDGAAGADGADGVDGNDWRVAVGAPSIIAGDEEGDLYLNSTNGDVYQVQTGAWVLVTNIQGADGADGTDGIDGTNGTNGTDGVDGADGVPTPVSYMKRSSTSLQSITSTPTIIAWGTLDVDNTGADISYNGSNQFVVNTDGDYKFGGFVTIFSGAQRAQAVVEIYINGVATGFQRSGAYIRNSGISYDYWALEVSNEPFPLVNGDTVELRIGQVNGPSYGYSGTAVMSLRGASSKVWFERISAGETGPQGPAGVGGTTGTHLNVFGPPSNQTMSGTAITVDVDNTLVEEPLADWTVSSTGEITWDSADAATLQVAFNIACEETGGTNSYVTQILLELNGVTITGTLMNLTVIAGTVLQVSGNVLVPVVQNDVIRGRARILSGTGVGRVARFGSSMTAVRIA